MLVLHTIWENIVPGKLHLWAETSDARAVTAKSAGRASAAQKPQSHPFARSAGQLLEAVEELYGPLVGQSVTVDSLALRLPSSSGSPVASPELLLDTLTKPGLVELQWWNVATATLDPSLALDFLLALPLAAPHGLAYSSSLRFWAQVANFSFELLARQSFAPTLQEEKRGNMTIGRAVWDAVLSPEDAARLQNLALAMPPVCWAYMPAGEKASTLRQDITRDFLQQTIDAFVRESLALTSLLPAARSRRSKSALPLHEQWLHALADSDPTFASSTGAMQQFSTEMHGWLDQLHASSDDVPFRTCFRLDAPGEEEKQDQWALSIHLQAHDDPSLLVPAEKVWNERSSTLTFLQHKFLHPQEHLLTDLGKASRLFPPLEKSLQKARPQEVSLDTEQAYTFLRESVPLLEQSGFGVLIPPWWQKRAARVGVKLKVKPQAGSQEGSGLMGLNSIVAYNWSIAVGDEVLTPEEFEELAHLKLPLVKVRGQWVELRPEEIEAAIAFFIGQKKNVQVHKFVCVGTLEERIDQMIEQKKELAANIVGSGENWLTEMSTAQLRDLFKLSREAVSE